MSKPLYTNNFGFREHFLNINPKNKVSSICKSNSPLNEYIQNSHTKIIDKILAILIDFSNRSEKKRLRHQARNDVLAKALKCSESAISKAIRDLSDLGLITRCNHGPYRTIIVKMQRIKELFGIFDLKKSVIYNQVTKTQEDKKTRNKYSRLDIIRRRIIRNRMHSDFSRAWVNMQEQKLQFNAFLWYQSKNMRFSIKSYKTKNLGALNTDRKERAEFEGYLQEFQRDVGQDPITLYTNRYSIHSPIQEQRLFSKEEKIAKLKVRCDMLFTDIMQKKKKGIEVTKEKEIFERYQREIQRLQNIRKYVKTPKQ